MKNTKIFIGLVATYAIVILTIGLIAYLLNDMTYKDTMGHPLLWVGGTMFAAIPMMFVGEDLSKKFN